MKKLFAFCLIFILVLSACSTGKTETSAAAGEEQISAITSKVAASVSTQAAGASAEEAQDTGSAAVTAAASTSAAPASSVADALAENQDGHDDEDDYVWNSSEVIQIALNGGSITADGPGVTVDGSTVTITSAGTYSLSGSLTDGQIIVNSPDDKVVRLILNGVDIHSATSAPIYVIEAEETIIILAENTANTITDGESYVYDVPEDEEPNAAIFSKSDLSISGRGSLTVNGNFNDGISSKDGLVIAGGAITVNSVDDGIRGKDYLIVHAGNISVNAGGDGLKSDNEEDVDRGYILVEAGVIQITSAADALDAQTDALITGGEFNLTSGGGSNSRLAETSSAKGIKGVAMLVIDGGAFTLNAADDALHSNGSIQINNGAFALATGDDGMHADSTLEINGGSIQITASYEGIESAVITINGGEIHVVSSDDGINVAGGVDSSGMGQGGMRPGGRGGQDAFTYSGSQFLYIHGGYIAVEANGDGFDINGAIVMTGGVVLVNGPTQNMNGALDYDAGFNMSGGFLVAAGSSGMAQAPGAASSQFAVLINFNNAQKAGTLVHIQSSDGDEILTFAPSKQYQSVAFSSPGLVMGGEYDIYLGGSATGTQVDSLYQDGTYSAGSKYASFTISGAVTMVGASGFRRP